ncbi:MAG: PIN domain-containing protein, partial [Planctomycetota bacterium]
LVSAIKLMVGIISCYLTISFILQTKDDIRFVIPYVEFARQSRGARPLILDTSVIIDGRIADICETRIIDSPIFIPRFVLQELQAIADSADKLKRNRGRRGLDMLNKLQTNDKVEIRISDARLPSVEEAGDVDQKLVALAKKLDGRIVTNDYNLNKIAQIRGVDVININDLANALKPVVMPGEGMTVKIIKPGEELGQGVGYLEDGTMVVGENCRDKINEEVTLTVTSVLQTSAGRMIFGRLEGAPPLPRRPRGR